MNKGIISMDPLEGLGPSAADADGQHLGMTSALTQALFPPSDSQAFQAVRDIRDALDEVQFQVKHDFLHKQVSRSGGKGNLGRSFSSGNLLSSPRNCSRPMSPTVDCREQMPPKPLLNSMLETGFLDYYHTRRASNNLPSRLPRDGAVVAATLGFPQPNRSAVAVTGLAMQERPPSPSGLKQVLSQLQPVRPPVVVFQSRCSSAEARPSSFRPLAAVNSSNVSSRPAGDSAARASAWAGSSAARVGSFYEHYNIRLQGHPAPTLLESLASRGAAELVTPLSVQHCSHWSGSRSPAQPGSPQSQLVLRSTALHTPHNIVARGCLQSPPELTGAAVSHSSPQHVSPCSCPAAQHPAASNSPIRLASPLVGNVMYCSGCKQQHTLQQHQSCCHQCPSCCQCQSCREQHQPPLAEASTTGSDACSCPCIKAYKKGHRDAQKAAGGVVPPMQHSVAARSAASVVTVAAAEAALTTAAAAAQAQACAHAEVQQQAITAAQEAAAEVQAVVGDATDAYIEPDFVDETAIEEAGPHEDHLIELLRQLIDMQQQLLEQSLPYEAQTLEDLSDQLAQMLAWSEPQHEEPLRQALAFQQELLAIQQRELLASNPGAKTQAPLLQLPQHLQQQQQQQQLEQQEASSRSSPVAAEYDRTGLWVAEHQQGLDSFRAVSTAAAVSNLLENRMGYPAAAHSTIMSEDDRLVAAAAAYEAVPVPTKPAAAAASGYNSRGSTSTRQAGKVSWVDNPIAEQGPEGLLGLLDLQDDEDDALYASQQDSRGEAGFLQQQHSAKSNNRSFKQQEEAASAPVDPEDSEAILAAVQAAYDEAFAAGGSAKPLVHFMMAPYSSAPGSVGDGGAVLHQGPPQVTAVAQVVNLGQGQASLASSPAASNSQAIPSDRSVADSAWSVVPSRSRNQDPPAAPTAVAAYQQQHFDSPAAAAAAVAGTGMQEQHSSKQLQGAIIAGPAPSAAAMVQHTGMPSQSRAASERDYLEHQLSRLSSVRGLGSAASSVANTPRSTRFTHSAAGANSSHSMVYAAAAAGLPAHSDPGNLSSGASGAAYANPSAGRVLGRGSSVAGGQQHASVVVVGTSGNHSARPSVRFLELEPLAPVAEQQAQIGRIASVHDHVEGSATSQGAWQQTQQQMLRQLASSSQQTLQGLQTEQATAAMLQQDAFSDRQHSQGMRRATAARAGSFEAPDSGLSSINHSARPSSSQLPVVLPATMGQMVAAVPVQLQAAASPASAVMLSSNRSLGVTPVEVACADTPNSSVCRQAAVGHTTSTAAIATVATVPAATGLKAASTVGSDSSKHQRMGLDSMVSPMASAPASNRTSISNSESASPAAQRHQLLTQQWLSAQQLQMQAKVQRLSGRISSRQSITASSSGTATPGTNSDWKQQQLMMHQQVVVQQQQLQQIKSISTSAASAPRPSAVTSSTTLVRGSLTTPVAGAHAAGAATRLSASTPSPDHPQAAETAGQQQVPSSRGSNPQTARTSGSVPSIKVGEEPTHQSVAVRASQQALNSSIQQIPAAPTQYAPAVLMQHALQLDADPPELPAAVEVMSIHSDEQDVSDDETASSNSLDTDTAAILHDALLQRLLRKKKGKTMQQTLNCWWRHTVAHKAMAAASGRQSERAPDTHKATSAAGANLEHQQQAHTLRVALKGLEEGLQQYLTADAPAEDVQLVISGEVRVQRSPIKQRPDSHSKAASVVAKRRKAAEVPGKDRGGAVAAADASAAAVAAYAKPLQDALVSVQDMIDSMEDMCISGSKSNQNRGPCRKSGNAAGAGRAVAASRSADRPSGQQAVGTQQAKSKNPTQVSSNSPLATPQRLQQQGSPLGCMGSPDKHKLRGQLKHVQDRLVKLEVKMYQAQSMADDWCCSGAANRRPSPRRHPASSAAAEGLCAGSIRGAQGLANGCGHGCKGGCVHRAGARRHLLVGRMQDEIGQLQQELAELRELLPGAYA